MTTLKFASSTDAATRGVDAIHYIASESLLRGGWLANVASPEALQVLGRAAAEESAGVGGNTVHAQHPGGAKAGGPKRFALTILPDARSRHNCPAAPEAAYTGCQAGAWSKEGSVAVLAGLADADHGLALARAVGRALPLYSRTSKKKGAKAKKPVRARLHLSDADGVTISLSKMDRFTVEQARWAAQLVDMPPSELHTPQFVRMTRAMAKDVPNLSIQVISGAEVLKRGMGGLHAVGRTAIHPPKVMILRYKPAKAKRHIGLVGKGVIYDTGGLSLKPSPHMFGMKCDMGGAAAVTGAALALAKGKCKDAVTAIVGLVENAIGPTAYRPDDILTMHSGKTVEINNTDAEGRLVLADAASYLARKYKLDLIIDMATLTGAQLIATGHRHAAIVCNRDGVEAAATAAGRSSGDLVHPLPFAPEFYQDNFRSQVADMRNSVNDRMDAQSSCAAQFVYAHIEDLDIPWMHVDLAGPAYRKDRGTGFGVALVARLVQQLRREDF